MLTWVEGASRRAVATARSLTVRVHTCARASRNYAGGMSSDRDTLAGNERHPRRRIRPILDQELGQCIFAIEPSSEHTFTAAVKLAIVLCLGMAQNINSTDFNIFRAARKFRWVRKH